MYQFVLSGFGEQAADIHDSDGRILALLSSAELEQGLCLSGFEDILRHTPLARTARVCKAEAHRTYLCGTIVTPRYTKERCSISFGYLMTGDQIVICDDSGVAHGMIQRIREENPQFITHIGGVFYGFLESLIAKDMHHLQGLEDKLSQLEEQVLEGTLDNFNYPMTALHKELASWIRYYTQLEDMVCELEENENGFFSDIELRQFHMVEKRIDRLKNESQLLREYGLQIRELFQAEIDIRQNRIMKILTIVTTVFLPLTLVAGWYGMNFANMPELTWKYGYPAVIAISLIIVIISLWIMKKKKFW
jgi:magnesium transporter